MKYISSLLLGISLTIRVFPQDPSSPNFHDNIIAINEYYVLRDDSSLNRNYNKKVNEIRNIKIAEQLFGINYNIKHYNQDQFGEAYTQILYNDGLNLSIPDYTKGIIEFRITSTKYKFVLNDGKEIKIGLDFETLKDIFPRSFSNQRTLFPPGNIVLNVGIVSPDWNNSQGVGAYIAIVINKDTKTIIEITTWVPD